MNDDVIRQCAGGASGNTQRSQNQAQQNKCACESRRRGDNQGVRADAKGHEVRATAKDMTLTRRYSPVHTASFTCLPHHSPRDICCLLTQSNSSTLQDNGGATSGRSGEQADADAGHSKARNRQQRADSVKGDKTAMNSCLSACFGFPVGAGRRYRSGSRPGRGGQGAGGGVQDSDPILRKPMVRRQQSRCFIGILRCWCVPGLDPDSSDEDEAVVLGKPPFSTVSFPALPPPPPRQSSHHESSGLAVP